MIISVQTICSRCYHSDDVKLKYLHLVVVLPAVGSDLSIKFCLLKMVAAVTQKLSETLKCTKCMLTIIRQKVVHI